MNVLVIAPDLGLTEVVSEARAVSLALHAVVLNGTVHRKDVLDALAGHIWDIIWFATHGDDKGIRLSDEPVSIADLTAIVRNSGAYLVVLNSCSSRYIGLEIHYELGVDAITTESAANDLTAAQTGTLLARNLATGMSIQDAFERSRPGQHSLYYLFTNAENSGDQNELRTIQMLNEWGRRIEKRIGNFEQQVDETIAQLRREMTQRFDSLDGRYHISLSGTRAKAWLLAFMLFASVGLLFIKEVRDLLDISWWAALVGIAFVYVLSLTLFVYGLGLRWEG